MLLLQNRIFSRNVSIISSPIDVSWYLAIYSDRSETVILPPMEAPWATPTPHFLLSAIMATSPNGNRGHSDHFLAAEKRYTVGGPIDSGTSPTCASCAVAVHQIRSVLGRRISVVVVEIVTHRGILRQWNRMSFAPPRNPHRVLLDDLLTWTG